jgi:hypothetical protein
MKAKGWARSIEAPLWGRIRSSPSREGKPGPWHRFDQEMYATPDMTGSPSALHTVCDQAWPVSLIDLSAGKKVGQLCGKCMAPDGVY